MGVALEFMVEHAAMRQLLRNMLQHQVPLAEGEAAMTLAATKGVMKVQLVMLE